LAVGDHSVNTKEYAYSVSASIETRGGDGKFSRTTTSDRTVTWNGHLW
jgi:hypothetical protein